MANRFTNRRPKTSNNITRLNVLCQQCPYTGVKINLLYIPGHSGIVADKHAKDTAYRVFKGEIVASINVSINTAFSVAGEIATDIF